MAQLVDIYNTDNETLLKRRQLPLHIYDNLTVSCTIKLHFDIITIIFINVIVFVYNERNM